MRREEIAALAIDAFEKFQKMTMLGMSNQPTDYEERKKAAVDYAIAKFDAFEAKAKLDVAVKGE